VHKKQTVTDTNETGTATNGKLERAMFVETTHNQATAKIAFKQGFYNRYNLNRAQIRLDRKQCRNLKPFREKDLASQPL